MRAGSFFCPLLSAGVKLAKSIPALKCLPSPLNKITLAFYFPIPRCDDALTEFGDAKYFILLDAHSGYHQIRMAELSKPKSAFMAPHGRKYRWNVMPFQLLNQEEELRLAENRSHFQF